MKVSHRDGKLEGAWAVECWKQRRRGGMQEGVEGVLDLALSARMIPNLQVSMSQELRFHFNV